MWLKVKVMNCIGVTTGLSFSYSIHESHKKTKGGLKDFSSPTETFQFISKRHRGFPFSLTFFLNGLQVDRLSSCCEFKHRKGSRLGGRHGHFGFFSVDGAQPCYRCIIAMGLDKKPTPPPKRMREDSGSSPAIELCPESAPEPDEVQEDEARRQEPQTQSTLPDSSKTEVEPEEPMTSPVQDDQSKDDYEEDFEADDEGPIEDGVEEADGKLPSRTNEGKKKDEIQDAPEGETAEPSKHPDSEAEDADKDASVCIFTDHKESRSVSSQGTSSRSGSDAEDSDIEAETRQDNTGETTKSPEVPPEAEPEEKPEPGPEPEPSVPMETQQEEDAEIMEVSSPAPPEAAPPADSLEADAEALVSAGDSQEKAQLEVSDSTEVEAAALVESEAAADQTGGSAAESEPERAKSVQEKLAEAILTDTHSSPEPELSDTSTEEEEEESAEKPQQDTAVAEPVASVAFSVPQLDEGQDNECEEGHKEIIAEESEAQASEERAPSPENVDKQPTEEDMAAEQPGTGNDDEKEEPADDRSESEKEIKAEAGRADKTPGEAENEVEEKVQNDDDDDAETAKEPTKETSTVANDTKDTDAEIKEELTEEIKDAEHSKAPLEEQENEEEKMDAGENTAEAAEGEPAETSNEPPESMTAASEVAQAEETSADDTPRQGTPDDQVRVAEGEAANANDTAAQGDSAADDAGESTNQEPDSSIAETSEKPPETIDTKECEENSDQKLAETKQDDSGENAVENGNEPQNTDETDNAEAEEKAGNSDEEQTAVKQETTENESVASAKEKNDVNECSEVKDKTVEDESIEVTEEQAKVMHIEQPEGDKVEDEAKEQAVTEKNISAENEVKAVDGGTPSCVSDGEKESSLEDKNKTEDKVADVDERKSVSDGEKEKVEDEGKEKLDGMEGEDNQDKTDEKVTEKGTENNDNEQSVGDEVKDEDIVKSDDGDVNERKADIERTEKDEQTEENEGEGEKSEKEKNDVEGDEAECTGNENAEKEAEKHDDERQSTVNGVDTKEGDGAEEAGKENEDGEAEDTAKDDNTDTKVEEIEKLEPIMAEDVGKNEGEMHDGVKESSRDKEKDSDGEKASECGSDDTMVVKREQGEERESEPDRDMIGEQNNDVEETIVQDVAVSGDGQQSQHGNDIAEVTDEVTEVKTEQAPVNEVKDEQESVVINDENGEKMTAGEARGDTGKESEVEGQEPRQSIDTEQRSNSERGEQEIEETKIEEITSATENDVEDVNGDDVKSERKLSSDGSVQTQVKVEDEKVKDLSGAAGDDRVSIQSKDDLNRQGEGNQDRDTAHVDRQAEETCTEIEPFRVIQEPENLNTQQNSDAMVDVPHDAGSDVETKGQVPEHSKAKDDTNTKEGQADAQEQDSADREHKEHLINGEHSASESLSSPVPLDQEEAGDLVSKWVNLHQTSRYFQTFVEPLDDMNETSSKGEVNMNGHSEKGEGSEVTNMPESDTLDQMSEKKDGHCSPSMSTHTDNKQETTVEDFVMETKEEKTESDRRSKHSNDESAVGTKDMLGERKDKEITDLRPSTETKYAPIDTASTATNDRENQPYEQGVESDRATNLIDITKTKDYDSKLDSESLKSESVSHAKRDNSVHSGHAEDTPEKNQKLRFDDVPQSVSRDRQSTFSVEDSQLCGPATYPRLATAHPEQSY
ncbi:hypothetical protein ACEWY4_014644 [Coilia grayii]|uniref:DUF4590 domain-containing protein n=1 Tax=Coilia grayii TaxID=363190 RepID=A0ABD1JSX8_9TELE